MRSRGGAVLNEGIGVRSAGRRRGPKRAWGLFRGFAIYRSAPLGTVCSERQRKNQQMLGF